MPDIDVKIQWHAPDQAFAAVFVRDGEPWYLEGALVGMGFPPAEAVENLLENAKFLVLQGRNALMDHTISLEDRQWLFSLLDVWGATDLVQAMYEAVRRAEEDEPYRTKTGKILTESEIYDLAQEAEAGYDIPLCGFRWREAPQPGEKPEGFVATEGPWVIRTCTLGKGHTKPIDHHDRNAPNP